MAFMNDLLIRDPPTVQDKEGGEGAPLLLGAGALACGSTSLSEAERQASSRYIRVSGEPAGPGQGREEWENWLSIFWPLDCLEVTQS